jgi:hypothetical protein
MIINALTIKAKINSAFDEFRTRFNPEMLYEALVELCDLGGRSVQICPGITDLTGTDENCLQTVIVDLFPLGTSIVVPFGGSIIQYMLTANNLQTVAPYVVRADSSTQQDPRTWIKAGSLMVAFTNSDLDEGSLLTITHNLGFPLINVLVFDENNDYLPSISFAPDETDPNTKVVVNIGAGFEGTRHALITY